jgi:hypothetical protein
MKVKSLIGTAVAVVVFVLAGNVIRAFVPWPEDLHVRQKLEAFEQHIDEFDALFFGSSRTFRDLVPKVIDPLLETPDRPFRSFNLGLPGGWAYEVDHLLEYVLERKPERLKYVILEVQSFGPWLPEKNRFSDRTVYPHCLMHSLNAMFRSWQLFAEHLQWIWRLVREGDPAMEQQAAEAAASGAEPPGVLDRFSLEYLTLGWDHFKLYSWRLGNYGTGPKIFMKVTGRDGADDDPYRARMAESRGYEGLDEIDPESFPSRNERRRRFERNLDIYFAQIEDMRANQFKEPVPLPEHHLAMFRRQLQRLEEAGLRVVLVVPPGSMRDKEVETMRERGLLPGVLWFQDPVKYPELYAVDAHFDANHLATPGAEMFSRMFAAQAAEKLAE